MEDDEEDGNNNDNSNDDELFLVATAPRKTVTVTRNTRSGGVSK